MFPFNIFPYTNFHDLNLDWLLNKVKELSEKVNTAGVLPAPLEGQNGYVATVINGEWKASGSVPLRLTDLEGKDLVYQANFQSINQRLEEIYDGIVQLSVEFDSINRKVVV